MLPQRSISVDACLMIWFCERHGSVWPPSVTISAKRGNAAVRRARATSGAVGKQWRNTVRNALLLGLIAILPCQLTNAREIRRDAIPEAFRGTWATGTDGCKDGDRSLIVLSAKSYAGPAGSCIVEYV